MNKAFLTGTLGRDPELRTTQSGISVCSFTMAVNGRNKEDEATWFRVTAWRGLAEIVHKYLAKGKKVAVVGPVSVSTYTAKDGTTRASLEVQADEVEFLSPRNELSDANESQFIKVDNEELPF